MVWSNQLDATTAYTGNGPPSGIDATEGDIYFDKTAGNIYYYDGTSWSVVSYGIAPGMIMPWAGGLPVPIGYLMCDGSTQLIATYPNLYAVIGIVYGGNGTTNFILPDLRARFPVGSKTGDTYFGTRGQNVGSVDDGGHTHSGGSHTHGGAIHTHDVGAHQHSLSTNAWAETYLQATTPGGAARRINIPSGNFTPSVQIAGAGQAWAGGTVALGTPLNGYTDSNTSFATTNNTAGQTGGPTASTSGSTTVNVLQPSVTMNYVIKT